MHRITLLSVGKPKASWIIEGCSVYTSRLKRLCDFSERVIGSGDARDEHEKIMKVVEAFDGIVIVLDETGKQFSSVDLASWIGKKRDAGSPMLFVLGGAYGLTDAIRAEADLILSFGFHTLPHELCKVVFLEQLYRAETILEGRGYHHE